MCLKDNVAVAGVPQFFGTDAIPAWIPDFDATVVRRVLDAGADIVGTTICENFCNSTSSFTVRHDPRAVSTSVSTNSIRAPKELYKTLMQKDIPLVVAHVVVRQ
jgi:hypothetical protein